MRIQEGHLKFVFETSDGSMASQYDEWSFYRKQFIKVAGGTKAVDFIYVDKASDITWLIEVKDYRHPEAKSIKPSELAGVVAQKVCDSLAGLAAARCNANDATEREFSEAALTTGSIRVVLHMEQVNRNHRFIDPANVLTKLKQQIKAVDAPPVVVSQASLKTNMRWIVT